VIRCFVTSLAAVLCCSVLSTGCSGCGTPPLATLVKHDKRVERDLQAQVGKWTKVLGKDEFRDGDGLRTYETAEATLELEGGAKVRVEADTTIRFRRNAPDATTATSVDVESGLAEVEAGKESIGIKTRFGIAILSSGGKVLVDRVDGTERYRVDLGEAVFPAEDGASSVLTQGQEINIGLAQMEPVTPVAPPVAVAEPPPGVDAGTDAAMNAAVDEQPADDGATAATPKDTLAVADHADFDLSPGGAVTVNDPAPPTAIGFNLTGSCPEGGALEVERRRAHGKNLNVSLKPGSHSYRVYCLDAAGKVARSAVVRGTIRVRRATGSAQLPTTAPSNRIDVDGRRYTVMFQNLLPQIEVRWPNAPTGGGYALERTFNGATTTERSATPSVRFAAGQVLEGDHRLRFKVAGGSARTSDETTLSVRFDNAAPSVSLRAPAATGYEPGAAVPVTGVAIAGTRVSILGNAVELDRQHRFDTSVTVPSGTRAFAVRIEHPRSGVNYYVRRERGSR